MSIYADPTIRACEAHEDRDGAIADRTDEIIAYRMNAARNALFKNLPGARDALIDTLAGAVTERYVEFAQLVSDAAQVWGDASKAEAVGQRLGNMMAACLYETASEGAADIAEQEIDEDIEEDRP